ncbi:MAG: hypothetical protein KTR14_00075 [Vampirovibrio sp.]|nr:hypothetical protein [Vampirovibrio sp.]
MTEEFERRHTRRHYDEEPKCTEIIERMALMDSALQTVVGQLIIGIADKIRSQQKLSGSIKDVSAGALIAVMTSKDQRRWYDGNPLLQKAFKNFYSLNRVARTALSFKIHESVHLVQLYLDVCENQGQEYVMKDVKRIFDTSFKEGGEEGKTLIAKLFAKSMDTPTKTRVQEGMIRADDD